MPGRLDNFASNVRAQLSARGWSPPELARRAGIGTKTLNNLLERRHHPQLNILQKVADALELQLWQMWLPQLPADAHHDETFPRLVTNAAKLSAEARGRVAHIVDMELRTAPK